MTEDVNGCDAVESTDNKSTAKKAKKPDNVTAEDKARLLPPALQWAEAGIEVTPRWAEKKNPRFSEWARAGAPHCVTSRSLLESFNEADDVCGFFAPLGRFSCPVGRIIALDFDTDKEGFHLGKLAGIELPDAVTQNTPSGGYHLFYTLPRDFPVVTATNNFADSCGVDFKCSNQGVAIYQCVDWDLIQDAPEGLLGLLQEHADARDEAFDETMPRDPDGDPTGSGGGGGSRRRGGSEPALFYDEFTEDRLHSVEQWVKGIDADICYDDWFRIVYALRNISNGDAQAKAVAWNWCAKSGAKNHRTPITQKEFDKKWHGNKPTGHGVPTLGEYSTSVVEWQLTEAEKADRESNENKNPKAKKAKTDKPAPSPERVSKKGKSRHAKSRATSQHAPKCGVAWRDDFRVEPEMPRKLYDEVDSGQVRDALDDLGISLAYNPVAQQPLLLYKDKHYPLNSDPEEVILRRILRLHFARLKGGESKRFDMTDREWNLHMAEIRRDREFNPFKEYLGSLPSWDGKPRLDTWFPELFATPDNPLANWAGKYLFLGAVQRTELPGCKLDEIPILVSEKHGAGKSAVVSSILPPDEAATMVEQRFRFQASTKEMFELSQGKVILEAAELVGLGKAGVESLKSYITATSDTVRLAYRKDPVTVPRSSIICGTTNSPDFIPADDGDNRRLIPVVIVGNTEPGPHQGHAICAVEDYMDEHRDQLWAEAMVQFKAGQRANLPVSLYEARAEATDVHQARDDILEDLIQRHLIDTNNYGEDGAGFTMHDIIGALGMVSESNPGLLPTGARQQEIGAALRKKGFVRKRVVNRISGRRSLWFNKNPRKGPVPLQGDAAVTRIPQNTHAEPDVANLPGNPLGAQKETR